ncbi:arylsulfatase [Allomuricauda sp. SCSIO 65647]|uniref:arylsulfatase n=1 Tax=Allomuricauda sp. SCSIO 65647 TaxID=2908843 RepID=UPI001F258E93|nr:arylsulfatase [Muricauda sp. SCSIO 65647]UJH67837.1 arylsulfatase [Muricauda sp. SCSIO 65647]
MTAPKIKIAIALLVLLLAACHKKQERQQEDLRPNIVLIMSDDMGYSDIAPYGGEIDTPNLQWLADNGVRFTQFYNTARCCPTRASLMTGCYPYQAGIGLMTQAPGAPEASDLGVPEYRGVLGKNVVTIAEVLKSADYRTIMTGKWHLGISEKEYWPKQRGFDEFYGLVPGAANYFKPEYPRGITEGNDTISITDESFYTTDAFTDKAIEYINQDNTSPFFLYMAYNAPHWPIQAPKEDIEKYRGKYLTGWDELRKKRYQRMMEMGLIDKTWKLSKEDNVPWDSLSVEKQIEMDYRMAIYAAMIDRMDQNIGKLLDSLKSNQMLNNTIIMFMNDNGACAEGGMLGWGKEEQLGTKEGYYLSYGRAWANASNTPFRNYKHWVHEGGIATPLIVYWPKGLDKNQQGKVIDQYGFAPDIMATCLDLAGAEYPKEFKGNTIEPMVGKSILPALAIESSPIHDEPIFWEHHGNKAVRLGNYKLVLDRATKDQQPWELYDLATDRTETDNLIVEEGDVANEMIDLYNNWTKEMGVLDWPEVQKLIRQKREELKNRDSNKS